MSTKRWNRSPWLAAIALAATFLPAWAHSALAQDGGPPPPPGPRGSMMGPGDGEADAVAETVEIYMIAKMKKALDLSREQEEKVVPLIQDLGEARRGFQRDRRLSMMKLRSLLEDPKSSDADLTKALNQIHDGERRFRDTEEKTHQQMRAVLTARQQAQFLIFLERFQSEMQQRVRRLRGRGQGPQGDPVGPGPMRRRGDRPR